MLRLSCVVVTNKSVERIRSVSVKENAAHKQKNK